MMACFKSFVIFIFTIFSLGFSDIIYNNNAVHINNIKQANILGYSKRKATYDDFMSTLSHPKTWINPHDEMIKLPAQENPKELVETTVQNANFNSHVLDLDADDRPVFSDVNGDVIVEKVLKAPKSTLINDMDTGYFQKDRQHVCVLDSIYISRWLEQLILKIETELNMQASTVSFQIDPIMLNNLKELSSAKSFEIFELDNLICSMLSKMVLTKKEAYDWTILQDCFSDGLRVIVYVMSIGFIFYYLYFFFKQHPKLFIFFCGLVIGVLCHWMYLCQPILSPFLTFSQIIFYVKPLIYHWFVYIVVFVMLPLIIVFIYRVAVPEVHCNLRYYLKKLYFNSVLSLKDRVFKTANSQNNCIKGALKKDSDGCTSLSDSLNIDKESLNSNFFFSSSNEADLVQSNENYGDPVFCCDSCDAHDKSFSEDNNSYTDSDDSSYSDSSADSQDYPYCINSELMQELHAGCRVCENRTVVTGSAGTSRGDSENLSKNEVDDFTDQLAPAHERKDIFNKKVLYKVEIVPTDSNGTSPIVDPSAG